MTQPKPLPLDRAEPCLKELYEAADEMAEFVYDPKWRENRHQPSENKQ